MKSFLLNQQRAADGGGPGNEALLDELVQARLETEQYRCQLRTLSDVVREEGVERIDLLKIDVENAEYEVLMGIRGATGGRSNARS